MGNHYQDSAAGRRGFFGTPGAEGAREIRSLLRSEDSRGYFGSQRFRERLLALLPKTDADIRTDQGQHYEAAVLMKDSAEDMAERIFIREPRAAGLKRKALRERPRSEPVKWKIARTMRTETRVSLR